ncbi:hypothetical protein LCGC14_0464670 [marine sediment metagenome]|uniref:Uncharacterized protein n=1 Tax=marine sediment metagenome TaxID=412755 RepID=A0A0F9SE27_9ZZZZ
MASDKIQSKVVEDPFVYNPADDLELPPVGRGTQTDPELSKFLLEVDPQANEFVNIYPNYQEKEVAVVMKDKFDVPVKNGNGELLYESKKQLIRKGYKRERVRLPIFSINSDMVKSQIGPREITVIMKIQSLINLLVFRQYKEKKVFTNNIVRFGNEIRIIINLRRAFGGFAGRLAKSEVRYLYSGTDESSMMRDLEEQLRKESLGEKVKNAIVGKKPSGIGGEANRIADTYDRDAASFGKMQGSKDFKW